MSEAVILVGSDDEKQMKDFYTQSPSWHEKIGRIYALLERVKISEEQAADLLHLRKTNRILSISGTTAIEGNRLSPSQVRDVINGKPFQEKEWQDEI